MTIEKGVIGFMNEWTKCKLVINSATVCTLTVPVPSLDKRGGRC